MASRPVCDRHPNLQMIRCSTSGYECPVPGCDRHCDDNGYFDIEVKSGSIPEVVRADPEVDTTRA
jgi:hypothetical protein